MEYEELLKLYKIGQVCVLISTELVPKVTNLQISSKMGHFYVKHEILRRRLSHFVFDAFFDTLRFTFDTSHLDFDTSPLDFDAFNFKAF